MYRDLWGQGQAKRSHLAGDAARAEHDLSQKYQPIEPSEIARFTLKPAGTQRDYLSWPGLHEIFVQQFPGVKTSRDADLISIDRDLLSERMRRYFDGSLTDEQVAQSAPMLMQDANRYEAQETRQELLKNSRYRDDRIVHVAYRPLDNRWLYWEGTTKLLGEKRSEFFEQVFPGNLYLETVRRQRKAGVFDHGVVIP